MKKTLLTLLFIFALTLSLTAEINRMWITGKAEKTSDIVPAKYQTANRERAACLIILTDLDAELDYQPNVQRVGLTHDKPGEWCFYIAPSERRVDIYAVGYEPLTVILREVGIPVVRSGEVYRLRLTGDKSTSVENINIVVETDPADASVYLNDELAEDPKQITAMMGKNSIRIERAGYDTIKEEIQVTEKNTYFPYKLALKTPAIVRIETEPTGATIFIGNINCGITPAEFTYDEGEYRLRILLDNYVSDEEMIVIKKPQTVKSYKLRDISGYLTVRTSPKSTIYINGEPYPKGVSRLKMAPQIVQVRITTPGEPDFTRSVAIPEGKEEIIEHLIKVDMGKVIVTAIPFDSQIELSGDDEQHYLLKNQTAQDVPVGRYSLEVKSDGYRTHKEGFSVKKDDVLQRQVRLETGSVAVKDTKKEKSLRDIEKQAKQTKPASVYEGQGAKPDFSLQKKRSFWTANKWIGLTATVVSVGAGVYFDFEGQQQIDDFWDANTMEDKVAAFNDSEASFDNRDMCYYVSIAPAAYTIFSWIKQASYNRKIKKMK